MGAQICAHSYEYVASCEIVEAKENRLHIQGIKLENENYKKQ
jgi:hypothetical protein